MQLAGGVPLVVLDDVHQLVADQCAERAVLDLQRRSRVEERRLEPGRGKDDRVRVHIGVSVRNRQPRGRHARCAVGIHDHLPGRSQPRRAAPLPDPGLLEAERGEDIVEVGVAAQRERPGRRPVVGVADLQIELAKAVARRRARRGRQPVDRRELVGDRGA